MTERERLLELVERNDYLTGHDYKSLATLLREPVVSAAVVKKFLIDYDCYYNPSKEDMDMLLNKLRKELGAVVRTGEFSPN